jgi:hypothetical protein
MLLAHYLLQYTVIPNAKSVARKRKRSATRSQYSLIAKYTDELACLVERTKLVLSKQSTLINTIRVIGRRVEVLENHFMGII